MVMKFGHSPWWKKRVLYNKHQQQNNIELGPRIPKIKPITHKLDREVGFSQEVISNGGKNSETRNGARSKGVTLDGSPAALART
jgi:hypothetical protein